MPDVDLTRGSQVSSCESRESEYLRRQVQRTRSVVSFLELPYDLSGLVAGDSAFLRPLGSPNSAIAACWFALWSVQATLYRASGGRCLPASTWRPPETTLASFRVWDDVCDLTLRVCVIVW